MTTFEKIAKLNEEITKLNKLNELDFIRVNGRSRKKELEKQIKNLEDQWLREAEENEFEFFF